MYANYHLDSQDDGDWGNLQRRLYAQQKLWIDAAPARIDSELERYEARYNNALSQQFRARSTRTLPNLESTTPLCWLAIFTRSTNHDGVFLRLLRRTASQNHILIGLEYIEARHQHHVDAFLANELSLEALSEALTSDADPSHGGWESYADI